METLKVAQSAYNYQYISKAYGHRGDLQLAANMEQVMKRLPSAIAEIWSGWKIEFQPKKVDHIDLDKWQETEARYSKKWHVLVLGNLRNLKQDCFR